MDIINIIKSRVSIRKYKSKPVPKEVLEDIVKCGIYAPCGFNGQDWAFVVITDQHMKNQISEAARYGRFIKDAGACIAVFYKKKDELAVENACAATENMIIAASAYGLGTCWVNSYRKALTLKI